MSTLSDILNAPVLKRSVSISGHTTSVSLEDPFWDALQTIAKRQGVPLSTLIARIDKERQTNLSSALRLYVLYELSLPVSLLGEQSPQGF